MSVPRANNRARPSRLSNVTFAHTSTSLLASRETVFDISYPLRSPLSSCSSDDRSPVHASDVALSSHAVVQALLDVAPKGSDNVVDVFGADEGNANWDTGPFAAPVSVSTSSSINAQLPLASFSVSSPVTNGQTSTKTSPMFAMPLLPTHVRSSRTMDELPCPSDSGLSPSRIIVESSQSQSLLPSAQSPRRTKQLPVLVIPSSQSQVLLPFMNSPRRSEKLFNPDAGNDKYNDFGEGSQIIGSSQSQIEKELSPPMGVFALPSVAENASQIVHEHHE